MTETTELVNVINDLEKENGESYSAKQKTFALHLATTGNQAEAAREAGLGKPENARQNGHKMISDPKIQDLVDEIQKYQTVEITEDFIKKGLIKEALEAAASRDRQNALIALGKTKGIKMFTDVVEQVTRTNAEILEDIEKEFGKEAADKAKGELGG